MDYFQFATHIAKKAGEELYRSFRVEEAQKRGTSKEVKSAFDRVADNIIINSIEQKFPTHSYFTEETGFVKKESPFLWIIDPLDGTGNFENHNPFFSVSVSLWEEGEPLLAVIEAPALKERFIAQRGRGAYRVDLWQKKKHLAKVSTIREKDRAYVIYCEGGEKNKQIIIRAFSEIYDSHKEFRKIGSAALELAFVGVGRADAYITFQIPLYDIAAGILFLYEAGGKMTDFRGREFSFGDFDIEKKSGYNLIAGNNKVDITGEVPIIE